MKKNLVGQIRIDTTFTSLTAEWDPSYHYPNTDKYEVLLRDGDNAKIEDTRKTVSADETSLSVTYDNLSDGGNYKFAIRGILNDEPGSWVVAAVALGQNPPELMEDHYMDQIAAGEETPDDAYGEPTRHVRLEKGVWTPFDPGREYKMNAMWWWYNKLDKYERACDDAEEALEEWRKRHPNSGEDHVILSMNHELACSGLRVIQQRILEAERQVEEEIELRYPPEYFTIHEVRWVQRPKRYHQPSE